MTLGEWIPLYLTSYKQDTIKVNSYAMLKLAAEAMTTAFENRGFYGRWGGDEFIACIWR